MKQSAGITAYAGNRPRLKPLRFLPALAVMGAIFILSSRTGDQMNTLLPWFRELFPGMSDFNWGHFFAYFLLALAFDFGFGGRADGWRWKLLIVLLCGLYGLTDEYHQMFVEGRSPDMHDIRNDCIGGAIAVVLTAVPALRRTWRKLAP